MPCKSKKTMAFQRRLTSVDLDRTPGMTEALCQNTHKNLITHPLSPRLDSVYRLQFVVVSKLLASQILKSHHEMSRPGRAIMQWPAVSVPAGIRCRLNPDGADLRPSCPGVFTKILFGTPGLYLEGISMGGGALMPWSELVMK